MTIRFRVAEIKVFCDVIDDAGNPTGERVEVVDLSKAIFDPAKFGMCGWAEQIVAPDSHTPQWTATAVECC